MLLTAVPFSVVGATWRLPDTYHSAGSGRGTATLKFYEDRDILLINLMGGSQTAVQRLDHHFPQLTGGLSLPYFYIGNEPEHGVPWAYNFAAHPSGTSTAVRRIMNESFTTGAGGLPGNDDLGATSAWYVWAALGMYPATPGTDTLALHGPLFPSIFIDRPV